MDGFTALKVISEIGMDMTKWPSAKLSISRVIRPGIYTDIRPPWGVVIR